MLGILLTTLAFGWNLVLGTGQAPADYVADHPECDRMAVYGYLGEDTMGPRWERHLTDVPAWVNTMGTLEPGNAYWVFCAAD